MGDDNEESLSISYNKILFIDKPTNHFVKVTNLPKGIPFMEVYNVFSTYGKISDPPNIQIKDHLHKAYIPYASYDSIECLLKETNGILPIRHNTVELHIEKVFGKCVTFDESIVSESYASDIDEDIGSHQETKVKEYYADVPRPNVKYPITKPKTPGKIQIRNILKLPQDLLLQYIKRSVAGTGLDVSVKIVDFNRAFDLAIFEFDDDIAIAMMLGRNHTLDEQQLCMSNLPPVCQNRFFIQNIPNWVSKSELVLYLESKAHQDVQGVHFNDENTGAVVTFGAVIDVDYMATSFLNRPFKNGCNQIKVGELQIAPIVYPDAVLVYSSVSSRDAMEISMEDNVSTPNVNRSVLYSIYKPEKKMWLVCFKDYKAVESFSTRNEVTINAKIFPFTTYFDCLGWRSMDGKADFFREYSSSVVSHVLSNLEYQFLSMEIANNYVEDQVKRKGCKGHFDLKMDETIQVVAENMEQSKKMLQWILDCVKTFTVKLDTQMLNAWEENEGKFLQNNNSTSSIDNFFVSMLSGDTLSFTVATTLHEQSLKSKLDAFFADNAIYENTVVNAGIKGLYLKKYHENAFLLRLLAYNITFQHNGEIQLKGTKAQLNSLESDVKEWLADIEVSEYDVVDSPGMPNFLQNQTGLTHIHVITEQTHTLILSNEDLNKKIGRYVASAVGTNYQQTLEGFINGKVKVKVVNGDITNEIVDAIVNAANKTLQHGGGLAKAIVDKGGQEIQFECQKYINNNGPLNVSDVFVSSGGKLPCLKVIHAVGPEYKDGRNNEDTYLRNTIIKIIQMAEIHSFKSIAIPAISTAIFRFPVEKAIPIIINAAILACRESNTLKEIRFVDTNSSTVKRFIEELKSCSKFQQTADSTIDLPLSSVLGNSPDRSPRGNADVVEKKLASPSNAVTIKLVMDDIVNIALYSEVIVNTTGNGPSDMFSNGSACKAIAKGAGQAYINDIQQRYPNGIENLPLVVTNAGNLGCKKVYHISCPSWNPHSSLHVLKDKICTCLDKLHEKRMSSIAFPAIGTGNSRYPAYLVADTMHRSVSEWVNLHPKSSLKIIFFVVFPADQTTVTAFEAEFGGKDTLEINSTSPTFSSNKRAGMQSSFYNKNKSPIKLIKGDIAKVANKYDVIVNTTANGHNDMFTNGNVCKAIAAAGGQMYIDDIKKKYPTGFGNAPLAVTNAAGTLGCKKVYHICTSSWNPQYSLQNLKGKMMLCLDEAETYHMSSIAFPAIGTGNLNYPADLVANTMRDTAEAWFTSHLNCHLKKVAFIVFPSDTKTVHAFEQEFLCQYMNTASSNKMPEDKKQNWFRKKGKGLFQKRWPFKNDSGRVEPPIASGGSRPFKEKLLEQKLKFHICGPKSGVSRALLLLDKVCKEECPERTIIKSIISQLDDETIGQMQHTAEEHFNVHFTVNPKENKITINGHNAVAYRDLLVDVLDNLTQSFEQDVQKENAIEHSNVKWFKRQNDKQSWQHIYDGELENQYIKNNRKGFTICNLEGKFNTFVDFDRMVTVSGSTVLLYLKRREINDPIPVEWNYNGKDSTNEYDLFKLDLSSQEYNDIKRAIFKTAPPGTTIKNIQRVENITRYKQFHAAKCKLENSLPSSIIIERKLFHGTDQTNVPSVCTTGFDRGLAGTNGTYHGVGSYFARDFSYSLKYTKTNTMFLAFVLTGRYAQGIPAMRTAPIFDPVKGTKYDSVVNRVADPTVFVVFTDNSAYPAYLISYA